MRIRLLFLISFLSIAICHAQYTHYFWIDENSNEVSMTNGERLSAEIDVSSLNEGFHTFWHYVRMEDGSVTPPKRALFLKTFLSGESQPVKCVVRIDNSISKEYNSEMTNGLIHLDADMSDLPDGFHRISVQLNPEGCSTPLWTTNSYFVKEASISDNSEIDCYAIVDNNSQQRVRCTPAQGMVHLNLNMQDLTEGIHRITLYLVPVGSSTVIEPITAFFIKKPIGESCVTKYSYWFDNDYQDMVTCDCEDAQSSVELVGLINAKSLPFRSSSFALGVEDDNVILTSKHEFNFRAEDNFGRFTNTKTQVYLDPQSKRIIPVNEVEKLISCTNKKVGAIGENDVKLYQFNAEIGDSLAVSLSEPASLELFSPTGQKVIEKKGRLSQSLSTTVLVETGVYYLAIHDVEGYNNNESLSFSHIPRNAIISVTPSEVSAPVSFFALDIFGNGFNNVRKLILESDNGCRLEMDSLYAHDNYHLTAAVEYNDDFIFGEYLVSLVLDDKISQEEVIVQYPERIKLDERDQNAEILVEVVPSRKASTPYMVDVIVTNRSDVPCWGIPLNLACELASEDEDEDEISYEFYIKDYYGNDVPLDGFDRYESDNLLGTERRGFLMPMILSYLQPNESRILSIGITSKAHITTGIYAWAGEPYNETADGTLKMTEEEIENMRFRTSNVFSLDSYAYLLSVMDELSAEMESRTPARARAASDNDWVLQFLSDNVPDYVSNIEGMSVPTKFAQSTVSIYKANAQVFAGIINCSSNMHAFRYFRDQCDIPGATLSEQIQYIYEHRMQNNPGIDIYLESVSKNMARTVPPRKIVAQLVEDISDIVDDSDINDMARDAVMDYYCSRQSECPNPRPQRRRIESLQAFDPNDLVGYRDPSGGPYIGLDISRLDYKIEFENDPTLANASAVSVKVENMLDDTVFDLTSYQPLSIHVGNREVKLPEAKSFVTSVDMRPKINCILEIRHEYNEISGESVWEFNSLDPISLDIVSDSQQGFLPVNSSSGSGVGEIEYYINLKPGLPHNTEVTNQADIVFDDNEAIKTPKWINYTDYIRPYGKITKSESESDSKFYVFEVECSDDGSGVHSYDLCAKTKNSDSWVVIKPDLTESKVKYEIPNSADDLEYGVRVTDNAGNRQIYSVDIPTLIENESEDFIQSDGVEELWYDTNGIRVDNINTVKKPVISNKGKKVINIK